MSITDCKQEICDKDPLLLGTAVQFEAITRLLAANFNSKRVKLVTFIAFP
jgi:hypothetical protein